METNKDLRRRYQAAVLRGAAFLDEHTAGWDDRVSLEELDMADPCHCILGQVYSEYNGALERLGLAYSASQWLGLEATDDAFAAGVSSGDMRRHYAILDGCWYSLIQDRQAAGSLVGVP